MGNISWNATEEDLKAHFEKVGPVEEVKIIFDRETNRSRGFGFVTMVEEADAQKAIEELNGSELDGREINVNIARPMEKN